MRLSRSAVPFSAALVIALAAIFYYSQEKGRAADAVAAQADSEQEFHDKIVPLLVQNCYECHGNGNHKGDLALDSFKTADDVQTHHKQWEALLKVIRGGVMPPPAAKHFPSFQERTAIGDWVKSELLKYAAAHPDPGEAAIHRLTRSEYQNTIRDLVGIDFEPGDDFPADGPAAKGAGEALLTPELKEKYLNAASRILDQAIAIRLDQSQPLTAMPAAMKANFTVAPTDTTKVAAAREILDNFLRRAWRRPVLAAELDALLSLFVQADKNGGSFQEAIKLPMKASLVSPAFLIRGAIHADAGDPGSIRPLSEYDLASRLSYFIWSSMPDDELLGLAEHQQLRAQLAAQVKRMMASPKGEALAENFSRQWLQTRDFDTAKPDKNVFPEFDAALREAMGKETVLFFDAVMREDRPVLDFLNGDYTFVNQRLAEFYGINGVLGNQFQRVSLVGTPRRGVLTQAGVLTATSNWKRTSIPRRAKFVLHNFLDRPVAPTFPPAPQLPNAGQPGSGTLRTQMKQHETSQSCVYCHVEIDPIGSALENFDGIGRWRDKDGIDPVDASGQLATGESFNGAVDMINILARQHRQQFVECLAEKMLGYALERGIEASDQPAVNQIAACMEANDLKFSSLVSGIANSMPFQMARGKSSAAEAP